MAPNLTEVKGSVSSLFLGDNELIRPDQPSRCTWVPGVNPINNPHRRRCPYPGGRDDQKPITSILQQIGCTPLVRLNKIPQSLGLKCEIYVKCEYFNPGGSIKDRVALRMVEDAEKDGRLKPGATLIEPTSGNTGIGLALVAAVKGYRAIIVMPQKMSNEKVAVLRALGAEIVRTPTSAAWDSPESHHSVAQRLQREIPDAVILDQYRNSGNPLAHYDTTAAEILEQCGGRVDMVVAGTGTGGTITGLGRRLKESNSSCVIVGVDPHGSVMGHGDNEEDPGQSGEVEGIGSGFHPTVLDREVVDKWVKTSDKQSFPMARRLIKEEGLLVGGSSGAAVYAACQAARDLPENYRVVVVLPDSVRNYMTRFLDDEWMADRGFCDAPKPNHNTWWGQLRVSVLNVSSPMMLLPEVSVQEAINIMSREGFDQLPVVDQTGHIRGMVKLGLMMSKLAHRSVQSFTPVEEVLHDQFHKVSLEDSLEKLSRILEKDRFALVVHRHNIFMGNDQTATKEMIMGMATQNDLFSYIMKSDDDYKTPSEDTPVETPPSMAVMRWKQANDIRPKSQKWYERKSSMVSSITQIFVKVSPSSTGQLPSPSPIERG